MNPLEKIILVFMKRDLAQNIELEKTLQQQPAAILPIVDAPQRNWPDLQRLTSGDQLPYQLSTQTAIAKYMFSAGNESKKTIRSLAGNPRAPRTEITADELAALEQSAADLGIGLVGYTRLTPELIFADRAVLFDSAIVLGWELDQAAVASAPSRQNYIDSISTYAKLGSASNQLVTLLRQQGFAAQASHPLGGVVLYPPLAARAGLGTIGRHGLLITPQFGPRQRLSAIFTSIQNLPFAAVTDVLDSGCLSCGHCQQACPVQAVYDQPLQPASGRRTAVDQNRCAPQFARSYGCSICLRECAQVRPGRRG